MKKWLQIGGGLALAIALIWWMFKDTNWPELGAALARMNWFWIGVSLVGVVASFFVRILRWRYIVRTARPVSFGVMFDATQIGFLANFTLPARAGELVRALVLSHAAKLPLPQCLAFVALDRVTDMFGLIAMLLVSAFMFDPAQVPRDVLPADWTWAAKILDPGIIRDAMRGTVVLLTGLVVILALVYAKVELMLRLSDAILGKVSKTLAHRVHGMVRHFAEGMHIFKSKRDMAISLFWSLCVWFLFGVVYYGMAAAFAISLPWYGPCVMVAVLAIIISMPGAPGFVGQFHAAIIVGIMLVAPTTDMNVARATAIVGHLLNLIPVAAVGIICLYRQQTGLFALSRESKELKQH